MAHPATEASVQGEALTLDEAASALEDFDWDGDGFDAPEEASEEPAAESDRAEEVETEEATDEVDDDTEEEAEEVAQEETTDEEPVEAIPAPVSWSAEQKEIFAGLPPEAQAVIVARESERDKGFQAKSTEVAEQRKQLEEATRQINLEREQYAQAMSDKIGQQLQEPSLEMLNPNSQHYNPTEYYQLKSQYDQGMEMRVQAQQQADYYKQQNAQQEIAQKQQFWAERNRELSEVLPEFIGDAQTRDKVLSYARDLGYSDSELEMARASDIVTIDKAMKYDALMAAKPKTSDKLKVVPKVVKPGAKQQGSAAKRTAKAQRQAHKKNGNVHTAAKLIEGLID